MRSLSQVPSRPPTFPLYKARSPGSVTAPWGKLWNRMAGLVSGRADSAARLPLIPYYPASPLSFSFFSPFSYQRITSPFIFYSRTPFTGTLSLSGSAREKKSLSAWTQRGICLLNVDAQTHRAPVPVLQPASRPRSPNLLSTPFQKEKKKARKKQFVYILPAFMPAGICTICPSCWPH